MAAVVVTASATGGRRRRKGWAGQPPCSRKCRSILFLINMCFVASIIVATLNVAVRQEGKGFHENPTPGRKPYADLHNSKQNVASSLEIDVEHHPPKEREQEAPCELRVRSVRDFQACYPPHLARALPAGRGCARVEEWRDVQRCLNHGPPLRGGAGGAEAPSPPLPHYDISLIGERNSGTKFATQELQRCFRSLMTPQSGGSQGDPLSSNSTLPTPTVKIHRDFHRHKHFFQPLYSGGAEKYRRHVVVALFRDPVEWAAAMRENPYHSPGHVAGYETVPKAPSGESPGGDEIRVVPLPWREFVGRPWTTDRTAEDLEILGSADRIRETMKGETCLYRFSVLDAIPCRFDMNSTRYPAIPDPLLRGYVPLYELRRDQSQRPFNNLLELRAEKIVNFLIEIPLVYKDLGGYVAVRYEDLVRDGTRPFLERVARLVGLEALPPDCDPSPPQPERLGRRHIPADFRRWVVRHTDPDLERLLGYDSRLGQTEGRPPTVQ